MHGRCQSYRGEKGTSNAPTKLELKLAAEPYWYAKYADVVKQNIQLQSQIEASQRVRLIMKKRRQELKQTVAQVEDVQPSMKREEKVSEI